MQEQIDPEGMELGQEAHEVLKAAAKPIEVLALGELGMASTEVGEAGSASRVRRMVVPEKGRAQMIDGTVQQKAARLAQIIREYKAA